MKIVVSQTPDSVMLTFQGSVDERGAAEMKNAFEQIDLNRTKSVTLDFSEVDHIGSAGLGKLLLLYKRTATLGIEVRINRPQPEIGELLRELKLDHLFKVS